MSSYLHSKIIVSFNVLMQNKNKQSYAPFGSVASKNRKNKKKLLQLSPGPGAYDVSLPFIEPVVQTIKKSNNNVIVKLGHFGTAAFLAGGDRFIYQKQQLVGPGKYEQNNQKLNQKNQIKRHRKYAAQKIRQILKKPFQTNPTITQVRKVAFDDQVQMPTIKHQSRVKVRQNNNIRGLLWSRMSQQRNIIGPSSSNQLGPGSYQLRKVSSPLSLERNPSCAFNSNSVKSYLDQIVFQTNQDIKARQRQDRKYKSDSVGPGSYDIDIDKISKIYKYQFFGSTQQKS